MNTVVQRLRALTPLQLALAVSVAVHAAALTVRFVNPEAFNRVFHDTPLEVVLVNSHSAIPPDKALALAQRHLQGGGDDSLTGRASSPLPRTAQQEMGEAFEEGSHKHLQQQRARQTMLLAQVRQQIASLPVPDPKSPEQDTPLSPDEVKRRRLLIKQLAEIERRIQRDNAGPRKHFIGPSTQETVYALYYDKLRHAIEDKGTQNFPVGRDGQKLYGSLTMTVTVGQNGRLINTEVVQSSGSRTLDRRAEAIVRSAAPFDRFSPEMLSRADQMVIVSRFTFTRDDTLQTRMQAAP